VIESIQISLKRMVVCVDIRINWYCDWQWCAKKSKKNINPSRLDASFVLYRINPSWASQVL